MTPLQVLLIGFLLSFAVISSLFVFIHIYELMDKDKPLISALLMVLWINLAIVAGWLAITSVID